jgi:hypothetical protein
VCYAIPRCKGSGSQIGAMLYGEDARYEVNFPDGRDRTRVCQQKPCMQSLQGSFCHATDPYEKVKGWPCFNWMVPAEEARASELRLSNHQPKVLFENVRRRSCIASFSLLPAARGSVTSSCFVSSRASIASEMPVTVVNNYPGPRANRQSQIETDLLLVTHDRKSGELSAR